MKTGKRSSRIVVVVPLVVILVGVGVWHHMATSSRKVNRITTVSGLRQIGLSHRLERNDVSRIMFQGEPSRLGEATDR